MTIQILICDDQALIRDGLAMLLGLEPDLEVVGVAADGAEAVLLAERFRPQLVLMDLKMPKLNGVEATRQICARVPSAKVLVLTTYDDDEWVVDAVRAGASGYLLKDTPRAELLSAVRGTAHGKSYLDPGVANKLLQHVARPQDQLAATLTDKLTEREQAVLQLIAAGLTNSEIASRLHLSEGTVRNHVSVILAKLGVSDRTQAAVLALRHGLG